MSDIHTNISEWMKMTEEAPVVISSRIRLARNLENHVHPLMFPSSSYQRSSRCASKLKVTTFRHYGSTK